MGAALLKDPEKVKNVSCHAILIVFFKISILIFNLTFE